MALIRSNTCWLLQLGLLFTACLELALARTSVCQVPEPHGEVLHFSIDNSRIFPNTHRRIEVYVPAQYRSGEAAAVYVGLDGLGFDAPDAFDHLIAERKIPVLIGIGVRPGTVAAARDRAVVRFDRSLEFDTLDDRLARFILEEVFPAVERERASDRRSIRLSRKAVDHTIGGSSTGGVAAFNVAWQRPDAFSRVFSAIGTYVGMRGAEGLYVQVRKTEPKPIRIFMQDGSRDEWPGGPEMGDWWMANQTMARALQFAGYDLKTAWGTDGHNAEDATTVFPAAMEWLWRDWPSPIPAGNSANPVLQQTLLPAQGWNEQTRLCAQYSNLQSDVNGSVFYAEGTIVTPVPPPGITRLCLRDTQQTVFAIGPREMSAVADRKHGTVIWRGRSNVVRSIPVPGSIVGLAFSVDGLLYVAHQDMQGKGGLALVDLQGQLKSDVRGLNDPGELVISPDGDWLPWLSSRSHLGWSYNIGPDGIPESGVPFYTLADSPAHPDSGGYAAAFDAQGRAYVGTDLGVQVLDRNGRTVLILPLPSHMPARAVCFGGKDDRTLFASNGHSVFARPMQVSGVPPDGRTDVLGPWGPG